MTTINEYLLLPYTVVVRRDDEGDFVAHIEELPGCVVHGATRGEALELLEEVQKEWIADALERGHHIPEPVSAEGLPSGKWVQRVPRSLHARLARRAELDGVSLNHLVSSMLAEALGAMGPRGLGRAEIRSPERTYVFNFAQDDFYEVSSAEPFESLSDVTELIHLKERH
jgi:antitoxin HicB